MSVSQTSKSYQPAAEFLQQHNREGSWPYLPAGSPSVEATAWSAIALRHDANLRMQVARYLLATQNPDGGWSTQPDAGGSDWTTSLALLALRIMAAGGLESKIMAEIRLSFKKALKLLLVNRSNIYSPLARILVYLKDGPDFDKKPRGWPWTAGTYNWAEPTSYTLLALKPTSLSSQPDVRAALKFANEFLIDQSCAEGGWNYGRSKCLSVDLPAFVVTTAEVLAALQDLKGNPAVGRAVEFLQANVGQHDTVMSLAWSAMCLEALHKPYQPLLEMLEKHQKPDGSFGGNIMLTGLAATALSIHKDSNPVNFASAPRFDLA